MSRDFEFLGEAAVYPGHPITLAYLITKVFPSYGEAVKVHAGRNYSAALASTDIPGAGGCVHEALSLLHGLREGEFSSLEEAFSWADQDWSRTDSQKVRDPERWRQGQEQADRVKPLLADRSFWWIKTNAKS